MCESAGPLAALGNVHADVLSHVPADEAEKGRLLEELRSRAKGAFKSKDMRSCDQLYSKAVELCTTDPVLYSNRAMVYLNLGKLEECVEDCKSAIALDGSNAKAHYRRAQALQRLGRFADARAAIEAGRKVKPDAFDALAEQVEEAENAELKAKAELRREAQDVGNAEKPQAPVSLATMVDRKNAKAEQAKKESVGDAMSAPKTKKAQSASMKGYKKTAEGKTTSFFHMDIDEEAKALLEAQGKAPKKLEGPLAETKADNGGSAWNTAGTWESKNMMKWAQAELDRWVGFSVDLPVADGSVKVTEVVSLEGNAEIVNSKGKRRRVMDLAFGVKWALSLENGASKATGKVKYMDVGPDDDPEVQYEVDKTSTHGAIPVADAFVKSSAQGLQPALQRKLAEFHALFAQQ